MKYSDLAPGDVMLVVSGLDSDVAIKSSHLIDRTVESYWTVLLPPDHGT